MQEQFKNEKYDINATLIEKKKYDGLNSGFTILKFSGEDLNVKLINSLRRVCSNYIPIYAYSPDTIRIKENTTIAYNNDMMKLDLSLLPVIGIDPELFELDEKYWYDVNYADVEREVHPNELSIEFTVSKTNDTKDNIRVTTNDCSVHIDGKKVNMYSTKYPILLIELKPEQSFKCDMKAVLGIAERKESGVIWKACERAFYEKNKETGEYIFTVHGNKQFSEKELLIRTCKFLISKFDKIRNNIIEQKNEKKFPNEKTIKFIFEREDSTVCEPINFELQNMKNIVFSGFSKPDQMVKSGTIIATSENGTPVDDIIDAISIIIKKYNKLGYLLTKIS